MSQIYLDDNEIEEAEQVLKIGEKFTQLTRLDIARNPISFMLNAGQAKIQIRERLLTLTHLYLK